MIKKSTLIRSYGLPVGIALLLCLIVFVVLVQFDIVFARPLAQESECLRNVTQGAEGVHRQPVINSQCNRVAFWSTGNLSTDPDQNNLDGSIEIFLAELGETGPITLTQITSSTGSILGGFNLAPSISGDGRRVAFFSDRDLVSSPGNPDANFEIFVAEVDGGEVNIIQVTNTTRGVNIAPSISDNGQYIAFASDMNLDPEEGNTDDNFEVFVARVDENRQVTISQITNTSNKVINDQPRINQDGDRIVFVSTGENLGGGGDNSDGNFEVFMAKMDIQAAKPSVEEFVQITNTGGGAFNDQPTIGTGQDGIVRIAFLSEGELGQDPDNPDHNLELFVARIDQTGAITYTQATHTVDVVNDYPEISTDGSFVAFVSNGNLDPLGDNSDGNLEQFLYEIKQDKLFQVSDTYETKNSRLSISEDGECMAFEADRDIKMTQCLFVDVSIQKTELQDPSWAGGWVTYTLTITNNGPSRAIGLVITDVLPLDIAASVPVTVPGNEVTCDPLQGDLLICQLPSLASGDQATIDVAFTTGNTFVGIGYNQAEVANEVQEREPANNQASITTTFMMRSDLSIIVAHSGDPLVGEDAYITYTLYVENLGPSLAQDVQITDVLPAELDVTANDVVFQSQDFDCDISDQPDGTVLLACPVDTIQPADVHRGRVVVPVNFTRTVPFSSAAQVTYTVNLTEGIMPDPYLNNNHFTVSSYASVKADLGVSLNSLPTQAVPGEPVTYTIVVSSGGPSTVIGAIVSDQISNLIQNPGWLCDDSGSDSQCGTDDPQSGAIYDVANLIPGQNLVYTAWGVLQPDVLNPVRNTAQVTVPLGITDTNPLNNTKTDSNSPHPEVDLKILKSSDPIVMSGFQNVTYTLVISNQGPSDASQVYVSDTLPASVTFVSLIGISPPNLFTTTSDPLVWHAPVLPAEAGGVITFSAYVNDDEGVKINRVAVWSETYERNENDNTCDSDLSLTPLLYWESLNYDETEGNVSVEMKVLLSSPISETVTVHYRTLDGTATAGADYVPEDQELIFAPGDITKTVSVDLIPDQLYEHDETVILELYDSTNAEIDPNPATITILNDENPPSLSISDQSIVEGDSGSAQMVFEVSLTPVSGITASVNYATANGTAHAGEDYEAASGTLDISPGQTLETITVTVYGDVLYEGQAGEDFYVNLSNPVDATLSDSQALGTIEENENPPVLNISDQSIVEGNLGLAQMVFEVSLTPVSGVMASVDYATADGTAHAGEDYATVSGTLDFSPGQTLETITVTVYGDVLYEGQAGEDFYVDLSNPVDASFGDNQAVGTIQEDENPPVLSISDQSIVEGNSGSAQMVFEVSLIPVSGITASVDYATADGTAHADDDYAADSGTLDFSPGQTRETITVTVYGDTLYEGQTGEGFYVDLSNPANATFGDPRAVGTIVDDDDKPRLSISDQSIVEGNSGTTQMIFEVSLIPVSGITTSVDFATVDGGTADQGVDYDAVSGDLEFPPGDTLETITVTVHGDWVDEGNLEDFYVNLSNPVNAELSDSQGRGVITDDDDAGVTIIPTQLYVEERGPTADTYQVELDSQPVSAVEIVIHYDAGQVSVNPSTLNFTTAPNDWQTSRTVTVTAVDDSTLEDCTHVTVITHAANSLLDPNYDGIFIQDVTVYIAENDGPDLGLTKTVNDISPLENGGSVVYTVTATNLDNLAPASSVVISDQLPAGVNFVTYAAVPTTSVYSTSTWLWDVGSLSPGQVATLVITATVGPAEGSGVIINTASLQNSCDDNPANDQASAVIYPWGNYYDHFEDQAYDNSYGSRDWTSDVWIENDVDGDDGQQRPTYGDLRINSSGDYLYFVNNRSIPIDEGISRTVQLGDATAAVLSFDYQRRYMWADGVAVDVSYDNGSNWITLTEIYGDPDNGVTDGDFLPIGFTLSPNQLSDQTVIRFRVTDEFESNESNSLRIDDVDVTFRGGYTYRDEFNQQAYNNDDGTQSWSTNWDEAGPNGDDDPNNGVIQVVPAPLGAADYSLRFTGPNSVTDQIIRTANLSGALAARLSFNYQRVHFGAFDTISTSVSYDNGVSWTTLDSYSGTGPTSLTDPNWQFASYDLDSSQLGDQTVIKFQVMEAFDDANDNFYLDNVEIWFLTADGGPPTLLSVPAVASGPPSKWYAASPGSHRTRLPLAEWTLWERRRLLSGRPGGVPR